MISTLHIHLLGKFLLRSENPGRSHSASPRLQALLTYLVLHRGAPQSRRQVAFLLWPESTERAAFTNLRAVLHQLRQLIPHVDRVIAADRSELRWVGEAACHVDVLDFEAALAEATRACAAAERTAERVALATAVELYGGELLPGCYDDWLIVERDRLHERYSGALWRLVALLEEEHDYGPAIACARRLVEIDPLDEAASRVLMRLHAAAGDRAAALRAYEACVARLQRELGVEPDERTREQYARLFQDEKQAVRISRSVRSTGLLGRDRELHAGTMLLADRACRLLTLTGPGGVGKTRLAEELAACLEPRFADGVCVVGLASVPTAGLVASAIAQALHGNAQPGHREPASLPAQLSRKHLLLVLDNFEHVLDAALLVAELLAAAPRLQVLATSRTPLGVSGEQQLEIGPLDLPNPRRLRAPETLLGNAAVQLFAERARSTDPFFQLTSGNAPVIAHICLRLDGLPLALELAAAWTRLLPPQALLVELNRPLDLLSGGMRDQPERHRTLRDTIAWSYRLLDSDEQILFARLGVFAGSFTSEAVASVCMEVEPEKPGYYQCLRHLRALVEKSLLRRLPPSDVGSAHFAMLDTIRQYARELCNASGEADVLRRRHARYYLALAERARPELLGPDQWAWMARLDAAHADLRAALAWLLRPNNAHAERLMAVRMVAAVARFLGYNLYLYEDHNWVEVVLAFAEEPGLSADSDPELAPAWAEILRWAAAVAFHAGESATARTRLEASVALWRALDDRANLADTLSWLAMLASMTGADDDAYALDMECVALLEQLGQPWAAARALSIRGRHAFQAGDHAAARRLNEERLAIERALNRPQAIADSLTTLALYRLAAGEGDGTRSLLRESVERWQTIPFLPGMVSALEGLGWLAAVEGRPMHAARIFGAAAALDNTSPVPRRMRPGTSIGVEPVVARVREALGGEAFTAAWNEGARLSLDQMIEAALRDGAAE